MVCGSPDPSPSYTWDLDLAVDSDGNTVPDDDVDATGCDIGQRRVADIDALDIPAGLKERLKPYCGLRRQAAVTALAARPLTITASEAAALDQAVKTGESAALRAAYDAATDRTGPRFAQLPGAVQTAIASVAFQYGTNLAVRTPRFWAAVTAQDWAAAVSDLRDFGDA